MGVLVTCKNEEDTIKNEGARVLTSLYVNFSNAQGQITLELVVVSGRNLNSSKLSCMSSLPARMRMIDSKMKKLECSQDFALYKSMGIFLDAQGQLTPQSLVRSGRISNSSEMLWMFSFIRHPEFILVVIIVVSEARYKTLHSTSHRKLSEWVGAMDTASSYESEGRGFKSRLEFFSSHFFRTIAQKFKTTSKQSIYITCSLEKHNVSS